MILKHFYFFIGFHRGEGKRALKVPKKPGISRLLLGLLLTGNALFPASQLKAQPPLPGPIPIVSPRGDVGQDRVQRQRSRAEGIGMRGERGSSLLPEEETRIEDSLVEEIRLLLEGIDFDCTIETLQMTNPVVSIKGPISVERKPALDRLASYQALSPGDRARFILGRYIGGGYLRYIEAWGAMDAELESLIDQAWNSAESGAYDALRLAERAIFALKSRGVP